MGNRYQDHETTRGASFLEWPKDRRIEFYKPPENGQGGIDIIPYVIRSEKHPLVAKKKAKLGELDYCLDIWVHRNIGPAGVDCPCLAQNYNRRCPLCEAAEDRKQRFGKEDQQYKDLRAKHRTVYNVYDNVKNNGALLVFDVSPYLFEEEIKKIAERIAARKGLTYLDYGNFNFKEKPEEGLSIWFDTFKEKMGGFDTVKFRSFEFRKHEEGYEITQKDVDKALSLDELLIVRDAKEMEQLLFGDDSEGLAPTEEETRYRGSEESPRGERGRGEVVEESTGRGGGRGSQSAEEYRPTGGRGRGESLEERDPPGRGGNKPPDEHLTEDDLPFEVESQEREVPGAPEVQQNLQIGTPRCPSGYIFGRDNNRFPECASCEIYNKCFANHARHNLS